MFFVIIEMLARLLESTYVYQKCNYDKLQKRKKTKKLTYSNYLDNFESLFGNIQGLDSMLKESSEFVKAKIKDAVLISF